MKYNRSLVSLSLLALLSQHGLAQKKQFTMAEAVNGMSSTLATKGVKNATWQPGTDVFWQIDNKDKADVWKTTDFSAGNAATPVYVAQGEYPAGEKITSIPAIKWLDNSHAFFIKDKSILEGTLAGNKFNWSRLATLLEGCENVTLDKSERIAYTIDNNLWYWDKEKGNINVSKESNKDIVCGKSVHRDEFGIDKGIFFSPKGNLLAFYRMDQRMVKDYPIIKWDTVPAMVNLIKYPMAGDVSHEVTLCVYDPATGGTVSLKTGEKHKDHYLTCVTWSPDEKYIYIGILSREQNHLLLNKYDAKTGEKVKTLFEESDKKYVHPTHPLMFVPGTEDQFVWWSERDGFQHLYLYNTEGKLLKQLTKGSWNVNEITGFDKSAGKIIFTGSKETPLEKHIYSVSLEMATIDRIDKGAGMHTAIASDDGHFVLDVYNGAGIPKTTVIRKTDGGFTSELVKSADPLADYDRPEIRNITIKAADGITPLYGKLILPTHFDSTKKYPTIVYLYNGPNVQLIHNSFPESGNLWYEYMAQHGYIVFTMDGRGSDNRGMAFEQATYRNLGTVETEDQMKGVEYLKSLPYVNTSKMGIHGWSFGGFMTTTIMLKHPDVFKCAVAGGPVMDWSMYEVMYTERYMSTPKDNPDGYKNSCLLDKTKNLKGKLMLIHGTNDNTVVWQHSIDFLKKCVDEGIQVDYFVYPGYEHNVRGKDRVHLMQKITDYFDAYLK